MDGTGGQRVNARYKTDASIDKTRMAWTQSSPSNPDTRVEKWLSVRNAAPT